MTYLPNLQSNDVTYATTITQQSPETFGYYSWTSAAQGGYWASATTYWVHDSALTETTHTTIVSLATSTIPYSTTDIRTLSDTLTSYVPASEALGLSDGTFTGLVILVIALLGALTTTSLIPAIRRPKQVSLSRFVKVPATCARCGVRLSPA